MSKNNIFNNSNVSNSKAKTMGQIWKRLFIDEQGTIPESAAPPQDLQSCITGFGSLSSTHYCTIFVHSRRSHNVIFSHSRQLFLTRKHTKKSILHYLLSTKHSGAFSNCRDSYFSQELVETKIKAKLAMRNITPNKCYFITVGCVNTVHHINLKGDHNLFSQLFTHSVRF